MYINHLKSLVKTLFLGTLMFASVTKLHAQAAPHPENYSNSSSSGINSMAGAGVTITNDSFILLA
jgi:hypothetical protein